MPFASEQNGFAGTDPKLLFNGPVQVRHIANMQDWIKKGYFIYAGRKNEPEAKFYTGECAMITTSSAFYGTAKQNAKFEDAENPKFLQFIVDETRRVEDYTGFPDIKTGARAGLVVTRDITNRKRTEARQAAPLRSVLCVASDFSAW